MIAQFMSFYKPGVTWVNTLASKDTIPSVVHIAVRRVNAGGVWGSYLSMWPLWIRADVLPPGDPQAIQACTNVNSNCSYKRTLLH